MRARGGGGYSRILNIILPMFVYLNFRNSKVSSALQPDREIQCFWTSASNTMWIQNISLFRVGANMYFRLSKISSRPHLRSPVLTLMAVSAFRLCSFSLFTLTNVNFSSSTGMAFYSMFICLS